jgi:hypothetical protein
VLTRHGFTGPFPESHGFDYLWVILDRLTSLIHLIPTRTTATAQDIVFLFMREVVCLHGLPTSIVSDRDTKFTSKFRTEVHCLMGIKLAHSTAFHPQTDGASECMI